MPETAEDISDDRGPVLVKIEYRIDPKDRTRFLRALDELGEERRRDGAFAWGIFEDMGEFGRFEEGYLIESWLELMHLRERVTNEYRILEDEIREMLVEPAAYRVSGRGPNATPRAAPRDAGPSERELCGFLSFTPIRSKRAICRPFTRESSRRYAHGPRGRRSRPLQGEFRPRSLAPSRCASIWTPERTTREVAVLCRAPARSRRARLVFPVWFDGLPAIMQGYFQRVFLPGVATVIDESGLFHPNLANIKRMAAVCAYGEIRAAVAKKHDPPRRFVRDNIGVLIAPTGRSNISRSTAWTFPPRPERAAFLERVKRAFGAW